MKESTRLRGVAAATLAFSLVGTALGDDPPARPQAIPFGFQPLEIYKLGSRISGLLVADFDGDRIDDIAVANNARSRIDLLLSRPAPADGPDPEAPDRAGFSDRRLTNRWISVNKEIVALQAGDFNGDGRIDLAFYGNPPEVIVLYNEGGARFERSRRFSAGDAVVSGTALAVGDLNRDGRDDLALLGPEDVALIYQGADGQLLEPERLAHTAAKPGSLKIVDLDGDGGNDLALLDAGSDEPLRVRFSVEGPALGPEQRFALEAPRAVAFADLDGRPGAEALTIDAQGGRVRVSTLGSAEEDAAAAPGRLAFYPLSKAGARDRSIDVGDLDGDGRADVVATDAASAQLLVWMQKPGTGLGAPRAFPGLVGGKSVKLADLDGDGRSEVYVLSEREKQVGRSVLAGDRLTFPAPLPVPGEPLALELADLDGDRIPEILAISRFPNAQGNDIYALVGLKACGGGKLSPLSWNGQASIPIDNLSSAPAALKAVDANGDGQPDLVIFTYASPIVLLGTPGMQPFRPAPALGPLAGLSAPAALDMARIDGARPALLLAQNGFARAISLGDEGRWMAQDQFDSRRGAAQVVGASAVDLDGDGQAEIVLMDRAGKALVLLSKRDGVYQPRGALSVGGFDFLGFRVADFDGDGKSDLLVAGADRFGVVLAGRRGQRLKTLATYESNRQEAVLSDLVVGDLNGDGRPDIALTDTNEHFVEIAATALPTPGNLRLSRGLAFKLYERKSFRDPDSLVEPRDIAVGDVDGDRRADLVLIVHDRVLVYRQDGD
ncbi:MAG: VCBS repeat-containing protein [Isosphaeraceae bacterium]